MIVVQIQYTPDDIVIIQLTLLVLIKYVFNELRKMKKDSSKHILKKCFVT